jgi:DNA recombination protein RmuC
MEPISLIVILVALIAVAALFLLLGRKLAGAGPAQRDLERRLAEEATLVAERTRALEAASEALRLSRAEADAQRSELATLTEKLAREREHAEERIRLLQDARDAMTRDFKLLAEEIFQRHGETFARKSDEQLGLALNPLRQRILEFQQSLQTAHTESEKERARLAEQIKTLNDTSARMSRETHDLAQALRGKSQTQGAWGEMILRTILEKSGLREGEEYVTQQSHTTEDGERLRPDVIVRLPNKQSIVIDAKVSLTAYAAAIAAETEEERALHLKNHVISMRQHVRVLASKEYQKHAAGALDYVVMFVPIEGALAAALSEAPELTEIAVESSVYIATPTTLMIALRTAANVWHVERRNRNAEEISRRAGAIYDKVVGFLDSMDGLGKALGTAQRQYDKATGQLSRGPGNVLRQLEQLKALGAKTGKSLPPGLLDDGDAEDAFAADQASLPGLAARAEPVS